LADCLFCDIIAGMSPARRVHEDQHTLAFLDAHPIARGHTLVIPKRHIPLLTDIPPADWAEVAVPFFKSVYGVARKLRSGLGCSHVTVLLRGMRVAHLHMHLVPSYPGEQHMLDLTLRLQDFCQPRLRPELTAGQLDDVARRISQAPLK